MSEREGTEHPLTPRGQWAAGRVREAELLEQALTATNTSQQQLADRIGVDRTRVRAMADPERSNVSVPIRLLISPRYGKVGDALFDLISSMRESSSRDRFGDNHQARAAHVFRELNDVNQTYLSALADGELDASERAQLRKEALEAQRVLSGLLEVLG